MCSRRKFIAGSVSAVVGALGASRPTAAEATERSSVSGVVDLCGEWLFRTDPDDQGISRNWHNTKDPGAGWRKVAVPHTWQVDVQAVPDLASGEANLAISAYIRNTNARSGKLHAH
jgi:hypothetical protein